MKSLFPSEEKSVLRSLGGLSPVLSCIRTLTDSDDHFSDLKAPKLDENCFRFLRNEPCVKNGNGFCMAISLVDGNTLFVSSTITSVLGYPKDMVVGTCIMNYLYPRDRVTFASQLTQGLQSRFCDSAKSMTHNQSENTFYCRIRQYHSLKCGYGVSDKKNVYKPFQVTIRVRDVSTDDPCVEDGVHTTCLIAVAVPLLSAYKISEEIPAMSSFSTRHTASCHFSHMDSSAIPYLGFLPQDVLGFSIFDFYHMDDMPQLKDIYELVVKEQGCSFRSKPYRLKAFNGCYVVLETEWSCFINPWSRKLEFVLGQHRVLKGPVDANVFGENMKEDGVVSDEILKESQRIQEEIKSLLSQPVKNHVNDGLRGRCPKRKRGLASFVSSLVDVCQGEEQNWNKEECSCSDHGSVVMGEISPHQEFNDSDPSSVTPPTSQEIRYQENIDRFFASHPKTYSSDGSGDCKANFKRHQSSNTSVDKESHITSADSGNGSMQTHSDESVKATAPAQNGAIRNTTHEKYPAISSLTEDLLSQHNRIIHHKYNAKQRKVKTNSSTNVQLRKDAHRMKRSSSPHLPDGGPHKHNKPSKSRVANVPKQAEDSTSNEQSQPSTGVNPMSGFSMNPPFSMGSFPSMSHTSSSTPWNSSSITASYANPIYNPGVPNFGMPNYMYMGGAAANGAAPSPFFMPVMYMGAMPFYPSIPPMMTQTPPAGVWPFNFGPACSMGLSAPVMGFNQTNLHPQNGQVPPRPQTTSNAQTTNPTAVDAKSTDRPPYENMDTNQTNASSNNRNRPEKQSINGDLSPRINSNNKTNVDNCKQNNFLNPPIKTSSTIASCLTGSVTFTQSGDSSTRTACRTKVDTQRIYNHDSDQAKEQSDQDKDLHDDSASLSSSYLLKSDDLSCQSPSERAEDTEMESKEYKKRPLLKDPPWMDGINMNSETIYRFQLPSRSLEDILKKDLEALKSMNQPNLVGKQLAILQAEINESAREKQEERTAMDTDGDQELQAGPSRAEVTNNTAQPPSGTIRLGFDTLEEDVQEEVQYQEAEMMIYMVGPQIPEAEDEATEPEDDDARESQESTINNYRPI